MHCFRLLFQVYSFNSDVLGTVNEFRKLFENPIARGRDSEASDKEKEISESKMKELLAIANQFMIRRTAALLTKYLPVKYEHVVFCKMAPLQNSIYENFVKSKEVKKLLAGDGQIMPLQAITTLKKLCNHPALVCKVEGSEYRAKSVVVGENVDASLFPEDFDYNATQSKYSGKLQVLERMLTKMRNETTDKMVLISNYTQTLDMFEKMCRNRQWGSFRLDGSLTIQKRQKMVERFNDPTSSECIFLLSSKAGGCGLNLIGANRLVLFDPDWNPGNLPLI